MLVHMFLFVILLNNKKKASNVMITSCLKRGGFDCVYLKLQKIIL